MKSTIEAYKLFHEGALAFAEIERNGIRIDEAYLAFTIERLGGKIQRLTQALKGDKIWRLWHRHFGDKAKLTSNDQLGKVLFGLLKYPIKGVTATLRAKTDAAALSKVDLPFVKDWSLLQKMIKTKNTFLEGIRRETVDGYLHAFFHLSADERDAGGARSMRSSSSDPNFQNFPARDEWLSKMVRRCFIPRPGCRHVENDFGGHEFKIAAYFWKDPKMIRYASDPKLDIHRDQAMKMFGLPADEVSKRLRYLGKNGFVFPYLYGSWYKNIAPAVWQESVEEGIVTNSGKTIKQVLHKQGITELGDCDPDRDAMPGTFEWRIKQVCEDFDRRFPVFAAAKEKWYQKYRERAGFRLLTGFWLEGLFTKNQCYNTPVQGPAFHCLLWGLIRLLKAIRKQKMKSLVIGQIHDCSLGDVPDNELQDYLNMVVDIFTVQIRKAWDWITGPLDVEAEVTPLAEDGGTWWHKKKWEKIKGIWREAA